VDFALKHGFNDKVMFGNILNVFLSYFAGECLPVKETIIHAQTINYHKPVFLNDKLTLTARVSEIHDSLNFCLFNYKFTNQSKQLVAKGTIQIGQLPAVTK
jgi:acyl dehydratase